MNRASPGPPGEGATGACDDDLERDLVRLNDSLIKISNIRVSCYPINPNETIKIIPSHRSTTP